MRKYCLLFLFLLFPLSSSASYITYYTLTPAWDPNARSATPLDACKTYNPNPNATYRYAGACYRTIWGSESFIGHVNANTNIPCPFGNTGLTCNASCDAPNQMINGQCSVPIPDLCTRMKGKAHRSQAVYRYPAVPGDSGGTFSYAGCKVTGGNQSCAYSKGGVVATCTIEGTYSGDKVDPGQPDRPTTEEPANCVSPDCDIPEPQLTNNNTNQCTDKVYDAEGRSQFVCTSQAQADQSAGGKCGMFGAAGSEKWVCTKPAPNPTSIDEKKVVTTTEKVNPDGSKDKTVTTTTTTTHCAANACNTTTTTQNVNSGTDSAGNPKPDSSTCEGPKCPKPPVPGDGDGDGKNDEDESKGPPVKGLGDHGEKGDFDVEGWDKKIQKSTADLNASTNGLVDRFKNFTSFNMSGTGSLPCVTTPAIAGKSYSICFSDYEAELLLVGNAIFLIACLLAAFIVFAP